MMVMGGGVLDGVQVVTRAPRVTFSRGGRNWTPFRRVFAEEHWLWRVTWHKGLAYGVSYVGPGAETTRCSLYSSTNGIDWQCITTFRMLGANEVTLRFLEGDEMMALVRPHYVGPDQVPESRLAIAHLRPYLLPRNPVIHQPNAPRFAVRRFDLVQKSAQRRAF